MSFMLEMRKCINDDDDAIEMTELYVCMKKLTNNVKKNLKPIKVYGEGGPWGHNVRMIKTRLLFEEIFFFFFWLMDKGAKRIYCEFTLGKRQT